MRTLLLLSLLASPALAASAKEELKKEEQELTKVDREVVDVVLKNELADIPGPVASRFMELRLDLLPEPKRSRAQAKRFQMETALKLFASKKKGGLRTIPAAGTAGCKPEYHPASYARILKMAQFEEVDEPDVKCVEKNTNCTEPDLICEFTLNVIVERNAEGKIKTRRYFIHPNDPINAKFAECRGKGSSGTNFFGAMVFSCNHLDPTPQ